MQDLQAQLEKFRLGAGDCELIAKLAIDLQKRAFSARLAVTFSVLARDTEELIATRTANADAPPPAKAG